MTKLDSSVYKKRSKLYRESQTLQDISLDNELSFDKYMQIRIEKDKKYQMWKFYNNIIKYFNKKEPKQ